VYSVGYQQKQVAPLDARLQLPESKFSHLLQSWDQLVATGQPHGQVSRVFETIFQLRQHTDSLERMSRRLAPDAEDFCWSRPTPPVEEEGEILVASADGKGYPELKTWALQWLRRIRELYAINRERLRHAPDSAAFADADAKLRRHIALMATMLFSIFATLLLWKINPRIWLTRYFDACAAAGGKPPDDLAPFLPWNLSPEANRRMT